MSAARLVREKLPLVTLTEFKKGKPARPSELAKVRKIARRLGDFMDLADVQKAISKAHVLGASSAGIQDALVVEAERLGFVSEKRGLLGSMEPVAFDRTTIWRSGDPGY